MRRRLFAAAVLLAACAASPPAGFGRIRPDSSGSVAIAFREALAPHQPAVLFAADASPRPAEELAEGQVRVTVAGHLGAVKTRDGSWLVQVPESGARITAYATNEGSAGAMLNVRGTNTTDVHTAVLPLPCAVVPGDALVVASTGTGRGTYWPGAEYRSACDQMLAVVFVPYPVHAGLLRPPAIGDGFLPRFMRSVPIPETAVRVERLPSVVDVAALPVNWAAWGAAEPTIPYLTGLLRPFCGECYDGWSTDTRTPDHQHPGYGTACACVSSQACVRLCSTDSVEAKRPLALAVVQRGLDLVGAFADGRRNYPLGGHSAGRKALVVMTGHLMGVEPFANPTAIVGPVFQEDGAYREGAWWFPGWSARWQFRVEPPFDGRMLAAAPSTWGAVDSTTHSTWAWMVQGYMWPGVGSQVGSALAMRLIGREAEFGAPLVRMVEQWMRGPSAEARAQWIAAGLEDRWGQDFPVMRGAGFCAAAWRTHAAAR